MFQIVDQMNKRLYEIKNFNNYDEMNFYHPIFYDLYKKLKSRNYKISVGLITKKERKFHWEIFV